jgi:hypothetical protein
MGLGSFGSWFEVFTPFSNGHGVEDGDPVWKTGCLAG